ncbi:Aromatic acid exporter family member 1 [Streptomyces sp. WMMB 714]|uniref:FUSC family protein n=1 Tax=Streptomyces sp. WMMB 714 TaxID=1286822 RepID=UPI000823F573|nr:aromatic acid exporter family protein [Streptomyces sp. WMMB 714]SCK39567.1 Aromatic acid exporter family member 1 [Streptomyces sp. WMMB 714]
MAEAAAAPHPGRTAPPQGLPARAAQWWRRAVRSTGPERHTLTLIGKSALVASLSWYLANDVMQAQSPAFAPFSTVLIVQITAYQSVVQALRYVGAVTAGVALQGLVGALAGPTMLSFALVALIAVAIGRWGRLGSQGTQVSTAAFFAFSIYAAAPGERQGLESLGQIILLVLIGCGVGIVVNVLMMPPMRYRSAEHGIHALGQGLLDLAGEMSPTLREGTLDDERTQRWRQRAARLAPLAGQAQSSVRTAWESIRFHPRRLLGRRRQWSGFHGYQSLVDALERVTYQVVSMTRSFDQCPEEGVSSEHREFLSHYGRFLAGFEDAAQVLAHLDEDRFTQQLHELRDAVDRAERARTRMAENADASPLPVSDPSEPYGILLAEAVRLTDEIRHTRDVLEKVAGESGPVVVGRDLR